MTDVLPAGVRSEITILGSSEQFQRAIGQGIFDQEDVTRIVYFNLLKRLRIIEEVKQSDAKNVCSPRPGITPADYGRAGSELISDSCSTSGMDRCTNMPMPDRLRDLSDLQYRDIGSTIIVWAEVAFGPAFANQTGVL